MAKYDPKEISSNVMDFIKNCSKDIGDFQKDLQLNSSGEGI